MLQPRIDLLHQPAFLGEIDGSLDGAINHTTWSAVISCCCNDITGYKPPYRFPDNVYLKEFDPNSDQISKQGADSCKSQWATMRLDFL